ncbi:hypothetical protein CSUI_003414 [Cystoisospora suis]|uniref:Transmembrane protein n=1 Tax=Cystoisospora suis TaxID=483139 RepID=A0A2C6L5M8_9APIC|nr:hypothetical protein CSUI_003414 [Cystoisospora suis]
MRDRGRGAGKLQQFAFLIGAISISPILYVVFSGDKRKASSSPLESLARTRSSGLCRSS